MSKSTAKSLSLLELIADGHHTLLELAAASQLPKSTTHRLLSALIHMGYVKQDGGSYRLGFKVLRLGDAAKRQLRVVDLARLHMEALSQETRETIHLAQLDGSEIVYVAKVDGNRGLQMAARVGLRSPAQTSALGKVLLSALDPKEVQGLLLDLPPRTERTITDPAHIASELARVRELGYALDREENEAGIRCVAAPVRDASGDVIAALSLSGATQYISPARHLELIPSVVACAARISRELGARVGVPARPRR